MIKVCFKTAKIKY